VPLCGTPRTRTTWQSTPSSHQQLNPIPAVEDLQPDIILSPPPGGAEIAVFGVVHGDPDCSKIGAYVLHHRPHTVVVETALNDAHGSKTGNIALLEDCLQLIPGTSPLGLLDARTRALAHVGAKLASMPDPVTSSIWQEVVSSPWFFSEHLAYAAAFAVNARLFAGDRPKSVTYQRLLWVPTLPDLDDAFGQQSALNYHDLVSGMLSPIGGGDPASAGVVEKIFIQERDAVLLSSLHRASLEAGQGEVVVGVVGASHIAGMRRLWTGEAWQEVYAAGASDLPTHRPTESAEAFGVRRALLEALLRLNCRADVLQDLARTLGRPPAASEKAYSLTHELYGSSRMLMAVLDEDQLREVCQGWRCNMWDVLAPLRTVRPVNGGPGYDEEMVLGLRTLNYELN
jgi:hypothetical protein